MNFSVQDRVKEYATVGMTDIDKVTGALKNAFDQGI
jgi:hypothetical protein